MRLLGLDPGLRHTGWGVIEVLGTRLRFVACGAVDSASADDLATRLVTLYDGLGTVIERFAPLEAAVEETVVNVQCAAPRSSSAMRAAWSSWRRPGPASPSASMHPSGSSARSPAPAAPTKDQVAMMVRTLLPGSGDGSRDATDALAVAICHAHVRQHDGPHRGGRAGGGR